MLIRLVVALIIAADSVAAGQEFQELRLAPGVDVGQYSVLGNGDLKRFSYREDIEASTRNAMPKHEPEWHPLRGDVRIPTTRSIMVSIGNAADVNVQIDALRNLGPERLKSLVCLRDISLPAAQNIGTVAPQLVELIVKPCTCWESPEGAQVIAKLQGLKFLHFASLEMDDYTAFGSSELIEGILKARRLRFLEMPCDKLKESEIVRLANHRYLERLVLNSQKGIIDRAAMRAFSQMRVLRELRVNCTKHITDADVLQFIDSPNMEFICLRTDATLTCEQEFRRRRPDCELQIENLAAAP